MLAENDGLTETAVLNVDFRAARDPESPESHCKTVCAL